MGQRARRVRPQPQDRRQRLQRHALGDAGRSRAPLHHRQSLRRRPAARAGAKAKEMLFLSSAEVQALAEAITPHYRVLVYTAAYTGLRAGELGALRRRDVDLLHGTLHVQRRAQGHQHVQREHRPGGQGADLRRHQDRQGADGRPPPLPGRHADRAPRDRSGRPRRPGLHGRPRAGRCGTATSTGATSSPPSGRRCPPRSTASASTTYGTRAPRC